LEAPLPGDVVNVHFENWLFFLFCWLGSVARAGGHFPDGTPREVAWGAARAASDELRQVLS
jgi:hypothetical protein